MNRSNVEAIYKHWYDNQGGNQVPLSFVDPVARLTSKGNHTWKVARKVRFSKPGEMGADESGDEQEEAPAKPRRKGKGREVDPCPRSPAAAQNRQQYLKGLSTYGAYQTALRLLDYSVCNSFALRWLGQMISSRDRRPLTHALSLHLGAHGRTPTRFCPNLFTCRKMKTVITIQVS
jgi:hypothetical protein